MLMNTRNELGGSRSVITGDEIADFCEVPLSVFGKDEARHTSRCLEPGPQPGKHLIAAAHSAGSDIVEPDFDMTPKGRQLFRLRFSRLDGDGKACPGVRSARETVKDVLRKFGGRDFYRKRLERLCDIRQHGSTCRSMCHSNTGSHWEARVPRLNLCWGRLKGCKHLTAQAGAYAGRMAGGGSDHGHSMRVKPASVSIFWCKAMPPARSKMS